MLRRVPGFLYPGQHDQKLDEGEDRGKQPKVVLSLAKVQVQRFRPRRAQAPESRSFSAATVSSGTPAERR